jgi:hypothetical protein
LSTLNPKCEASEGNDSSAQAHAGAVSGNASRFKGILNLTQLQPKSLLRYNYNFVDKVGDWVEVAYEYAPGTCSDGGVAFIMAIEKNDSGRAICTVSYIIDSRIEKFVDQARITVTIMPYKDSTSANRQKRAVQQLQAEVLPDRVYEAPERSNLEWLEFGLKSRTHEKKGWLKEKLLEYDLMEATDEALCKRVLSDYKCELAGIEGMRLALGLKFKDPRETKGHNGEFGKFVSQKKESQLETQRICGLSRIYYTRTASKDRIFKIRGKRTRKGRQHIRVK